MHPAPISWKSTREAMYSNYMGLFFVCLFLFFFRFFLVFSLLFFFIFLFFIFFFFVYCCFYLVFKIFFFHLQKVKVARFSRGQQTQLNWKKKAGKIPPSITSTLKFPLVNHVDESQYCWGINHYN